MIKLILITHIYVASNWETISDDFRDRIHKEGTIVECEVEEWNKHNGDYIVENVPIYINGKYIGKYNRVCMEVLSEYREKQINSILED